MQQNTIASHFNNTYGLFVWKVLKIREGVKRTLSYITQFIESILFIEWVWLQSKFKISKRRESFRKQKALTYELLVLFNWRLWYWKIIGIIFKGVQKWSLRSRVLWFFTTIIWKLPWISESFQKSSEIFSNFQKIPSFFKSLCQELLAFWRNWHLD